jgi:hypothetical protein
LLRAIDEADRRLAAQQSASAPAVGR